MKCTEGYHAWGRIVTGTGESVAQCQIDEGQTGDPFNEACAVQAAGDLHRDRRVSCRHRRRRAGRP